MTAEKAGWNWRNSILTAALAAGAWYAIDNWDTVSTKYFGMPYTCENMVTDLVRISSENSGASSPKVVGILDRKTISSTPTRVECRGVGVLSNGTKIDLAYRAYIEGEQWWIFYEGE